MEVGLWFLIKQTDITTKAILVVFLMLSILCWAIILYKSLVFRIKLKQLDQAYGLMQKITTMDDLLTKSSLLRDTFAGLLIAQYLSEFKNLVKSQETAHPINRHEWQVLQDNINFLMEDAIIQEEKGLPFLATCAAISPLIGLFGTVWGLIHAFMSIGTQKSADIAAVAPGIAEALITTLAGLIVAIPALIMFNYLRVQIKSIEHALVALSEKSLSIMKLSTQDLPSAFPHQNPAIKAVTSVNMAGKI